jgi:hypothetical protein
MECENILHIDNNYLIQPVVFDDTFMRLILLIESE